MSILLVPAGSPLSLEVFVPREKYEERTQHRGADDPAAAEAVAAAERLKGARLSKGPGSRSRLGGLVCDDLDLLIQKGANTRMRISPWPIMPMQPIKPTSWSTLKSPFGFGQGRLISQSKARRPCLRDRPLDRPSVLCPNASPCRGQSTGGGPQDPTPPRENRHGAHGRLPPGFDPSSLGSQCVHFLAAPEGSPRPYGAP